jgi:hypothetical protein
MIASLRRSRRSLAPRRTLALAAALTLGLAACGDDGDTDEPEVEAPADDGVEDDGLDGDGLDDGEDPTAAPGFEDLEDGEVVPGVYLDVPVDDSFPVQAQPTPVGSAYVAAMTDQAGAVSLNVEFDGQSIDELLSGIDDLVEAGQAEVVEGPDEVEVEGAEEAVRIELAAPEGGATATGIFATTAEGHAVSLAVEVTEGSDIDVEAVIDSLRIDPERIEMAGTLEVPEGEAPGGPGGDVDGSAGDDGVDPEDAVEPDEDVEDDADDS